MVRNYILFCMEYANFSPRILLVPTDKSDLSSNFNANLEILRNSSQKYLFNDKIVENIVLQNITTINKNYGSYDNHTFSQFVYSLMNYAENGTYFGYSYLDDKIWADDSLYCRNGYDGIDAYLCYRNVKTFKSEDRNELDVNIIEGFVVLETRDGVTSKYYDVNDSKYYDLTVL